MSEPVTAPTATVAVPKKAVYTLMLINFVDLMGFGLVVLLLPYYALRFDASTLQVALLLSTFSFCQFIGAPILGAWSDRVGRRPVLMFSQWGSVAGYLILALSTSVHWSNPQLGLAVLFLSRIVDGFTAGNITVTNAFIADVVPPRERAGMIGMLGAAFGIGFAFGPPIGGLLGHYHHAYPGLLAAFLSGVASIMVWRYLPESHTDRKPTNASTWFFAPSRVRAVRKQPMVIGLTLIWFLCMLAYVMLEPTIPLILQGRFGYGEREAGLFFGAVGLIIIFVQGGLVRPLNKVLGEWPIAVIGSVCGITGLLLYAQVTVTPVLWLIAVAAVANAFGRSLQTPTLSALLSQNADPQAQGAAYGVYQGMASLARVFGPLIAGALYDRHATGMFVLAAALIGIACVILILLRPHLRQTIPNRPEEVARAETDSVGA